MRLGAWAAAAAALLLSGACRSATAQPVESFYKANNLNIVVGYTTGGGYDQYARLLGRHIARHVPGHPAVVIQNMPGAGSLTAVLYLDASAPKDGTVMSAFNPGLINDSFANPEKIKMKFSDLAWVGSITRDFRVCYAWHATGIATWDDLVKRDAFILGAIAAGTGNDGAVMRNVFGIRIKRIMGYPGSNEQRMAIERGELDGNCGSWGSIPPDWVANKKINVLVRFSPVRTPDMPEDAPFIYDLATTQEQRDLLDILLTAGELGRPFVMSKTIPADRLAAIRAGFGATMSDKAFLADAAALKMPVYSVLWEQAERTIEKVYAAPPQLVAKAKNALKD
jgi:tripartite-type tricarboxylate transporter receptor subunit TctC